MPQIYTSIDQLIGKTPLLQLCQIEKIYNLNCKIIAKLEFFNPAGSIKDRVAKNILDEAEKTGKLTKDSTILEPTSGNTGIGISSIAALRGYKVIIIMPETMSIERQKLMKAYGAEIILTPGSLGMKGSIDKANELAKTIPNSFIAGQFINHANPQAHEKSTGPEIWQDTNGNIDIFISGIGTGGTITGTGKFLKSKNQKIKIIGIEPKSSPILSEGKSGAHKIQGIGAGFIPEILDTFIYDSIIKVDNDDAIECARKIGKIEGFLVGISSGAALWAAIQEGKKEENKNKTIVTIFPDTGERYLSTELFSI